MILRILGASILALCLGFIVEDAHAETTILCSDGHIARLADNAGRDADPCARRTSRAPERPHAVPSRTVPLPVQRPARAVQAELKGPASAEAVRTGIGAVASVDVDYRRVRIINARPGAAHWYQHSR